MRWITIPLLSKEAERNKSWKLWVNPMTEPYSQNKDGFVSDHLMKQKLESKKKMIIETLHLYPYFLIFQSETALSFLDTFYSYLIKALEKIFLIKIFNIKLKNKLF